MARPKTSDYLQSFRFHVIAKPAGSGADPLEFVGGTDLGVVGFQTVSVPDLSTEAVEYRDGLCSWTKKQVGLPTFSDVSMTRGSAATDTKFYDWAMAAMRGDEYRVDLTIKHFDRGNFSDNLSPKDRASRQYVCYDCICIRCKPGADLDANSGDVSLAEVDAAIEWMEVSGQATI